MLTDYEAIMARMGTDEMKDCWDHLAVLSDWLEEDGRQTDAESIRWCVAKKKRPYINEKVKERVTWFNADKIAEGLEDSESDLPEKLYEKLLPQKDGGMAKEAATASELRPSPNHVNYKTVTAAMEAVMAAWSSLDQSVRVELMNSTDKAGSGEEVAESEEA